MKLFIHFKGGVLPINYRPFQASGITKRDAHIFCVIVIRCNSFSEALERTYRQFNTIRYSATRLAYDLTRLRGDK